MKYPRTPHARWSEGYSGDDIRLANESSFLDKDVVVTEKIDGENSVLNRHGYHARSENSTGKHWQSDLARIWSGIRMDIPDGMEICGENIYAVHSIEYTRLTSSFYVFGIVDNGICLSWEDVCEWTSLFGLQTVPILGYGKFTEFINIPIPEESKLGGECEGYVIRNIHQFSLDKFDRNVCKCVRKGHVQSDIHWTKNWKKARVIHGLK